MKFSCLKKILLSAFFIIAFQQLSVGQYFSVGNDPAGIQWKKISNGRISLIYPDYYEQNAKQMLFAGSKILPSSAHSLNIKPYPIKAIIHPETIVSNGWSMWVPRKIELSSMPSLYPMAERYTDHLLIHEFRHIAQLDKLDQGMTKVLSWFLGDQASASVHALHVSDWFSEGDAVLAETLLSNSGRGRSPVFSQGLRALVLDTVINYKFDKARFGSYKDFAPNHYVLGYHMVSMTRILDQEGFWSGMLDNIAKKPWMVSNFNFFLRKRTGLWQGGLFSVTKDYLHEFWKDNLVEIGSSQLKSIKSNTDDYINYIKPFAETDSSWICLKKSYADIPAIIRLHENGSEQLILRTGSINEDSYYYSNGQIVWAQNIADPRWEMRSFSDIFHFDISTGKKIRLTKKQRLLYPVLNSDNTMIACVEERTGGSGHLVILNIDGTVRKSIQVPAANSIRQTVWSDDNNKLYALLISREGKKLTEWNLEEGSFQILKDFAYKEINQLTRSGNKLIFTAPIGSTQGLYAYNIEDGSINKILADTHGLSYPTVHGDKTAVSVFTSRGYKPAEIKLDPTKWLRVTEVEDLNGPLLGKIDRTEMEVPVDYSNPDTSNIRISKYKKIKHLFNFHSWAPAFVDVDNTMIYPGAMIMSQNDLNTLISTAGVKFNRQTNRLDAFAELAYTGIYPRISIDMLGGRRELKTLILDRDTIKNVQYFDLASSANVSLPLFYSTGAYYQRIQPYFSLSHHKIIDGKSLDEPPTLAKKFEFSYATATLGIAGQVLRRMSYRDLYPRLGFTTGFQIEAGIANPEVQAFRRYSGYVRFYSPGLLKHHSLRTYVRYTDQNKLGIPNFSFKDLPRGHYEPADDDYYLYRVDYSFPIAYPDWSIPSFLYITRFKANLFFDRMELLDREEHDRMSTGIDLLSNFYLLRIKAEIEAGIRIIYDPLEKDFKYEFLYSFDIN